MAEYSLQKLDTTEVQYQVHEVACDKLKDTQGNRYLGSYGNPQAAFNKAVGLFSGVSYCADCIGGK